MSEEFKTWATLKPGSIFINLFPDGKVPILNLVSIQPNPNAPPCYYTDRKFLSDEQAHGLAVMLRIAHTGTLSLEEAIAQVQKGCPLNAEHFSGVTSTDFAALTALMDDSDDLEFADGSDDEGDYDPIVLWPQA